ncbi:hypothetical protein G7B40_041145 [Aetokthonos hydrillicola Thurmond2011]|uniref:Uncharacterized protein n=1 Tax=Aetokthonos hydrillicola Thurmond2011 TaxID=2712845 RepID=A0AAP5IHC8_9CYAN|nr:hypothetical protein [Aetokthonos hydrillicola]MDR9900894.1 hypothetical protein [Aetokthonos hydrillicola Thurmond2011]
MTTESEFKNNQFNNPIISSIRDNLKNVKVSGNSQINFTNEKVSGIPDYIKEKHWDELVNGSAINPELASHNFRSVSGASAFDYIFYSEKIERTNTGRLDGYLLKKYSHIYEGGWYGHGVDASQININNIDTNNLEGEWELPECIDSLWGCLKPNQPRLDSKKEKMIKYEHPLETPTEAFFLKAPAEIWELTSKNYAKPRSGTVFCHLSVERLTVSRNAER